MLRPAPLRGERLHARAALVYGLYVFDGEDVVRRLYDARALAHEALQHALAYDGVAVARGELGPYRGVHGGVEQSLGGALERRGRRALRAEAEIVHDAQRVQQPHGAARETLGRGERPLHGQLEDHVRPAAHGAFRARRLRPLRRLAALDKIARHTADYARIRPQSGLCGLDMGQMPVVEGVVFGDQSRDFHVLASKKTCVLRKKGIECRCMCVQ